MRRIAKIPWAKKSRGTFRFPLLFLNFFFFNLEHKSSLGKVAVPIKKFIHTYIYVKYMHKTKTLMSFSEFHKILTNYGKFWIKFIFSVLISLYFLYLMTICSEHLASIFDVSASHIICQKYELPLSSSTGCLSSKQTPLTCCRPPQICELLQRRAPVTCQHPVLSFAIYRQLVKVCLLNWVTQYIQDMIHQPSRVSAHEATMEMSSESKGQCQANVVLWLWGLIYLRIPIN